jgi:hypothetical protein
VDIVVEPCRSFVIMLPPEAPMTLDYLLSKTLRWREQLWDRHTSCAASPPAKASNPDGHTVEGN